MPKPDPNDPTVQYRASKNAKIVPQRQRIAQLPRIFGTRGMLLVENHLYRVADKLLVGYSGAYWEMVRIADQGFYMFPTGQERWQVRVEGNGYSGEVSPDAAGIIISCMTYSHLSGTTEGALQTMLIRLYDSLRDYYVGHPEGSEIYSALD